MKKNNQQLHKKSTDASQCVSTTSQKSTDALQCVSTAGVSKSTDAINRVSTDKQTVIKVQNASKIFKIPHKKIDSLRSVFVNMGRCIN